MKEQEFRNRLQHLYGDIPEETHLAFMQAVTGPKREKKPLSAPYFRPWPVILILITMLACCTAAYAASPIGLYWYYQNYESREWMEQTRPGLYDDIINNIRSMPEQITEDDDIIDIAVTDVSWIPERKKLVFYISANPKNPDKVELYPVDNLNVDGWEDDRTDNWLWTEEGFGPVLEQVKDPNKDIWFLDICHIYLGDIEYYRLSGASFFPVNGPSGTADYHYEFNIDVDRQDERIFSQIEKILQQDQVTLRIEYTMHPYNKETDEVPYKNLEKKNLYVTVDLTPKSPKEF